MAEVSWEEQVVGRFFQDRKDPTQAECDDIAKSITDATEVRNVDAPGATSYTVICRNVEDDEMRVISFRESGARLDDAMGQLAHKIHGSLVPLALFHGPVTGSDPPLFIYSMPYLRGISWLDAVTCKANLDESEKHLQLRLVQDLAQYFARCWANPQAQPEAERESTLQDLRKRITLLKGLPFLSTANAAMASHLQDTLPHLFDANYPQVLTHGDLSLSNILVEEETGTITGIVDWPLASILPFGMELDVLLLATGYMDRNGWNMYSCHKELWQVFWVEFWSATEIKNPEEQEKVRRLALASATIGAILRYAFKRNEDGSPGMELVDSEALSWKYLRQWFLNVELSFQ